MKKLEVTAAELDIAYSAAVARAGENPNALGFMRRVVGSQYYRPGPNGRIDMPSMLELVQAYHTANLAARVGRW